MPTNLELFEKMLVDLAGMRRDGGEREKAILALAKDLAVTHNDSIDVEHLAEQMDVAASDLLEPPLDGAEWVLLSNAVSTMLLAAHFRGRRQ